MYTRYTFGICDLSDQSSRQKESMLAFMWCLMQITTAFHEHRLKNVQVLYIYFICTIENILNSITGLNPAIERF